MRRQYRSITRLVGVIIVPAIALATTFTIQAQSKKEPASQQVGKGATATTVISPASQRAAHAFWTREAIAAAQPMQLPVQAGPAVVDAGAQAQPEAAGAPGFAAAALASPEADRVARAAYPQDWATGAEQSAEAAVAEVPEGTSGVYTSYMVTSSSSMQTLYPHRWIGRLSFSTPNGTSYCSGTSISGNVMLTAAHCLYDTTNNRWYSNWVFTPAYRNGSAPYGSFAATQCWVLTTWVNLSGSFSINSWTRHDVGVCKMGTNSSGTTLNNAVGWMGRQWNYSHTRHFHNLGYPFRDYNNNLLSSAGLYLRTCVAESFQQTTDTRGMGCNLGGGISGGPWMIGYAPNVVAGAADGVNSGIYIGSQNIYGARFNDNNIVPLCSAAAC